MRVYKETALTWCILIAIVLLFTDCHGTGEPDKLAIPGTGACEFILGELAREFNRMNPGKTVIVPPSTGSFGGIRSVRMGEAMLGRVARKIKLNEKGYDLDYLPFARDAVVFAVSGNVTIRGLSSGKLADIFSGKTGNWEDAGFQKGNIHVLIREPGDSSLTVIRKKIPEFKNLNFKPGSRIQYRDCEMLNILNKYSNTIGFLTKSSLINSKVRALELNGIAPSEENIINGTYSMVSEYALVYREGRLNRLAELFISFLFSPPAENIFKKHGIVHIKR